MKKWQSNLLTLLIFLFGVGIFLYPTVSDWWNSFHQSRSISSYEQGVRQLTQKDYTQIWDAAREYNASITENEFRGDAFGGEVQEESAEQHNAYRQTLNIDGSGIMGFISIPKIGQKIPIYHGVSEAVLQIAAGHIEGTRLPIGGAGNHSVIAAHRGLPSAKLFSDLDRMTLGDRFYVHILGEVLSYQVDQIMSMVEKEDYETLTKAMSLTEGEDYITLFTCTPYGINTHRMLVRGVRVEYHGEEDEAPINTESMLNRFYDTELLMAFLIIACLLLVGMLGRMIFRKGRRK